VQNYNFYCSILKQIISKGIKPEKTKAGEEAKIIKKVIENRILLLMKILHKLCNEGEKDLAISTTEDTAFFQYIMNFLRLLGKKIHNISTFKQIIIETIPMICKESNLSLAFIFVYDFLDYKEGLLVFQWDNLHIKFNPINNTIIYLYLRTNLLGGYKIWHEGKVLDNSLERQINKALLEIKKEYLQRILQES
jgi:F0F1-type ATP synthase delta subunit